MMFGKMCPTWSFLMSLLLNFNIKWCLMFWSNYCKLTCHEDLLQRIQYIMTILCMWWHCSGLSALSRWEQASEVVQRQARLCIRAFIWSISGSTPGYFIMFTVRCHSLASFWQKGCLPKSKPEHQHHETHACLNC